MAQQKQTQEQDMNQLLKVRRDKLKELQESGKDPFVITKYDVTHHSQEIKDNYEELEDKEVTVAGRMMSKRVMGKASFCNVQDLQGAFSAMWRVTMSARNPTKISRKWISAISWA